jgi:hypothetical protein
MAAGGAIAREPDMTDRESEEGAKPGLRRSSSRRARQPVTIDLAGEPPAPEAAAAAGPADMSASASGPAPDPAADPGGSEPVVAGGVQPAAEEHTVATKAEAMPESSTPDGPTLADGTMAGREASAPPISPFPPRADRPKTDWSSAGRLIAAGVFGGALATVLGILYHASGIIPTRAELIASDASRQAAAVAEKLAVFENRLKAVESAAAGLPALTERVVALEKLEESSRSRIERLENLPVGDGGSGPALGAFDHRLAAVETAVAGLGDRVEGLSTRLDELAARPPPAVESERATRAIAIGLLRQGAASGEAFAADLAMLRALGMDNEDVTALEPLARTGAPTIAALQAQFPAVANAILAASAPLDAEAGFFDRLAAFGRGLVSVRPIAPIEGTTPQAIVSRMQAAVARGDLAAALREGEALPTEARTVSAAWARSAADRAAIDAIVERLALSVTPPAN